MITAPLVVVAHLPLAFPVGWTPTSALINIAVLVAAAPFYRYLLGMHLIDTLGSILGIGVQHASWNASASIDGLQGGWQPIAAVALLTLLVAIGPRFGPRPSRVRSRDDERATAAS